MGDDDPAWDVAVNVQKGKNGYGIYFTNNTHTITVTKLDKNSEAELAGVQPGDILYSVQDLDGILPVETPGKEIVVCQDNYQTSLSLVRAMRHCRLTFQAGTGFG